MKPIRWTNKRKSMLRRCIRLAFESWLCDDDYSRKQANEIHEFEVFLNERGLGDIYEKGEVTFCVKKED